jgi:hypothetical protein
MDDEKPANKAQLKKVEMKVEIVPDDRRTNFMGVNGEEGFSSMSA